MAVAAIAPSFSGMAVANSLSHMETIRGQRMKTAGILLVTSLLLYSPPVFGEAHVTSASPRVIQDLRGDTVLIPSSAPEKHNFFLVTYFNITVQEQLISVVALYDDPNTRIKGDYIEIYQVDGDLLGIAWFDKFGVLRAALDYAFVEEDPVTLTGVLILLDEGIPL